MSEFVYYIMNRQHGRISYMIENREQTGEEYL